MAKRRRNLKLVKSAKNDKKGARKSLRSYREPIVKIGGNRVLCEDSAMKVCEHPDGGIIVSSKKSRGVLRISADRSGTVYATSHRADENITIATFMGVAAIRV